MPGTVQALQMCWLSAFMWFVSQQILIMPFFFFLFRMLKTDGIGRMKVSEHLQQHAGQKLLRKHK